MQHSTWLELLAEERPLEPGFLDRLRLERREVREIMSAPVIMDSEGDTLASVAELMVQHKIKRVPVAAHGKVVGIVGRADLVRALARQEPYLPAS